jgi:hypothetical protein
MDQTPGERVMLVKCFNRQIAPEDAIIEMDKLGYRPAIYLEAYAFAKVNSELLRLFHICVSGSYVLGEGADSGLCSYKVNILGDFSIRGVAARRHIDTENDVKKATVYRVEVGDVRIAVLGNIDYRLNDDQLEEIGLVDIVIVPVGGGGYTLDATNAAALVRKIDCKVAIPVHYADKALHYEVPQEEVGVFVKEFGGEHEVTPKYKVKSAASVPTSTTVIEITRS